MFALVKIVILCLLSYVVAQRHPAGFELYDKSAGEPCGENNEGVCALVVNCPEAVKKLKMGLQHGLLKCGYQGFTEIVCCMKNTVQSNNRLFQTRAGAACGRYFKTYYKKQRGSFIIGGLNASLGDFPYAAALGYTEGEVLSNKTVWRCGGTLISESYILTAAHCIYGKEGRIIPKIVRLGKIDVEGDEDQVPAQDIPVSEVQVHPKFHYLKRLNDIALLKLEWPANFTDYVKPVCLSTEDDIPTDLIVIGWGVTDAENDTTSRFLQKAFTKLHDFNKCVEKYSLTVKRTFNDGQFCALSSEPEDGKMRPDFCDGDSGGPIIFENTQDNGATPAIVVGIVSYSRACSSPTPSVYTKVSEFIPWIEDIVWPLDSL